MYNMSLILFAAAAIKKCIILILLNVLVNVLILFLKINQTVQTLHEINDENNGTY